MERVRAKKHLGQHFLKDENIASKIVESVDYQNLTTVLEVGPGTGVLTKYLIKKESFEFYAFDVDKESIDYLKQAYGDFKERFLLEDFLRCSLKQYGSPIGIIGNFPYNISSQLFFKVWEEQDSIDEVVCMIQKEVADRIVSKEGNKSYGILSVLLQSFYDIEYLFTVPPQVFVPPPKVQSAVIRLKRNETKELGCDPKHLKMVVKSAFGKRRKTLRNALKDLALPLIDTSEEVFDKRAEQLSVAQFIDLTNKIFS
ncbi:MAG: 16S rRNA (adenine(1518)-N(6)/adenine(1519)-N(6))-dimethyltransferase RsmA [Cyclobacteriaceae bacterium]